MSTGDICDPEQAAKMCGIRASALQIMRTQKKGPKFEKIGRRIFYRVADVKAWIAERDRVEP